MQPHGHGEVGYSFRPFTPVACESRIQVGEILNATVKRRRGNLRIALRDGQSSPLRMPPCRPLESVFLLRGEGTIVPNDQVSIKPGEVDPETRAVRLATLNLNLKKRSAILEFALDDNSIRRFVWT